MQLLQPFLCFDTSLLHIEVDSVEDCALYWIYIDINNAYLKKKKIAYFCTCLSQSIILILCRNLIYL